MLSSGRDGIGGRRENLRRHHELHARKVTLKIQSGHGRDKTASVPDVLEHLHIRVAVSAEIVLPKPYVLYVLTVGKRRQVFLPHGLDKVDGIALGGIRLREVAGGVKRPQNE